MALKARDFENETEAVSAWRMIPGRETDRLILRVLNVVGANPTLLLNEEDLMIGVERVKSFRILPNQVARDLKALEILLKASETRIYTKMDLVRDSGYDQDIIFALLEQDLGYVPVIPSLDDIAGVLYDLREVPQNWDSLFSS